MNYYKKLKDDNNLEFNEIFKVIGWSKKLDMCISENYEFYLNGRCKEGNIVSNYIKTKILTGEYKIEKIKPKTLLGQLKEQGFGWFIGSEGTIHRVDINKSGIYNVNILDSCEYGNVKLIKSDAEREVYRRGLEFEMQEWAREHECLVDMRQGARVREDINLWVLHSHLIKCRTMFAEK